ncbi:MAG: helix-turn-helix transcriptional regulator [Bacteroidales bacterium]|nr:helix-turn-helix transcriptional regulator [Bacteroidales bacterium]
MQEQIQEILRREDLSSSQFADKIGVQRSSVSHVLSGRNKPGFDFIYKILESFTGINAEWLITGYGDMYKQLRPSDELFDGPFSEISPAKDEINLSAKLETPGVKDRPVESETLLKREVERVIVFFTDKTFREYKAEP